MNPIDEPPREAETPVYLSTAELSRRWHVSVHTLRNWRFKGVGPAYFKPAGENGIALYKFEDVLAWEKAHSNGGER